MLLPTRCWGDPGGRRRCSEAVQPEQGTSGRGEGTSRQRCWCRKGMETGRKAVGWTLHTPCRTALWGLGEHTGVCRERQISGGFANCVRDSAPGFLSKQVTTGATVWSCTGWELLGSWCGLRARSTFTKGQEETRTHTTDTQQVHHQVTSRRGR